MTYHHKGYIPFRKAGTELLFEVIRRAYEYCTLQVTTYLVSKEWTEIFGSERLTGALLDRLTHRCRILEAISFKTIHTAGLKPGTRQKRKDKRLDRKAYTHVSMNDTTPSP